MKSLKNFFSLFTFGKTKKCRSKNKSRKNMKSKKRAFKMRGG